MSIMKYSFAPTTTDDERQLIVDGLTTLSKVAISKKADRNVLATKYSVSDDNYSELNNEIKEKILLYSAKQSGIPESINVLEKKGLAQAFSNSVFEWNFFAVQTEVLGTLLADTEVVAMASFIGMSTVGLGDSKTFYMGSKALYDVEDASYGNRVTRPRKQFKTPVTITPSPKEASVQFDVVQLLTANYDFGAEIAKIVISIRAKQYSDAVAILYNTTPLSGTPFYKATFNLTNYTALADVLGAVNGSNVVAYGTRQAYRTASATITEGFSTLDEINKNSFVSDIFGVSSVILEQAVDTGSASFSFRVPNDRLILIAGNSTPIQMVQEDYVSVELQSGETKNVMSRVYKYIFSYNMGLATADPYGIQAV